MNGMERGEALKFEAALKAVGFATTLVADHERPQLHDPIYPSLISHEK